MPLRLKLLNGNSPAQIFVLKLIIASLIIFSFVILFLFALFPSDISVSRLIQIRTSKVQLYKKIEDLREWNSWNDFFYNSYAGSVSYAHGRMDSNYIDKIYVQVELLKATPDTVITRWSNRNKFFIGEFVLKEEKGQMVLEWTLKFHIKWYPWEKLASMFYDKQLGPQMENSLLRLRNELESK
jgi:hypothetical protein